MTNPSSVFHSTDHSWGVLRGDLGWPWPAVAWSRASVPGQRLRLGSYQWGILSCVCTHLLVKVDSTKRPMGRLDIILLLISKDFFWLRFPWLWVWDTHGLSSAQGPATSLDFPAINILELLSTGNELKLLTPGGGGHLPPASGAHVHPL